MLDDDEVLDYKINDYDDVDDEVMVDVHLKTDEMLQLADEVDDDELIVVYDEIELDDYL